MVVSLPLQKQAAMLWWLVVVGEMREKEETKEEEEKEGKKKEGEKRKC